jgi:hypothetical protein
MKTMLNFPIFAALIYRTPVLWFSTKAPKAFEGRLEKSLLFHFTSWGSLVLGRDRFIFHLSP